MISHNINIHDVLTVVGHLAVAGASLAVYVPVAGTISRWRATHQPKAAIQLEGDVEGAAVPASPRVNNVFKMFGKVYRAEGVAGLYKGTMPLLMLAGPSTLYQMFSIRRTATDLSPNIFVNVLAHIVYHLFVAAIALPLYVLLMRNVTTPVRLAWFKPMQAIRVLFTPAERSNPFSIYLTPGLFLGLLIQEAYASELLGRRFDRLTRGYGGDGRPEIWRLAVADLILTIGFVCMPPLQVATSKLAVQRTGEEENVTEESESVELYSTEVVGFRSESYTSLLDCLKKVRDEEGTMTLYRLWWINVISVLALSGVARWAIHELLATVQQTNTPCLYLSHGAMPHGIGPVGTVKHLTLC